MTSKWHKTVIAIFFLISSVTALAQDDQASLMTYMHQGKQYIVVQIGSTRTDFPGGLVAYRLGSEQ